MIAFDWSRGFVVVVLLMSGVLALQNLARSAPVSNSWFTKVPFSPHQRARLDAVTQSLALAEAAPSWLGVVYFATAVILAGLTLVAAIPPFATYSIYFVIVALLNLIRYLYFRQTTRKRVAVLRVRRATDSLPPAILASIALGLVAMLASALLTRDPWLVLIAIAGAAILLIAWRTAVAPAVLAGNDLAVETCVDEYGRRARVASTTLLAFVPMTFLLTQYSDTAHLHLPVVPRIVMEVAFVGGILLQVTLLSRASAKAQAAIIAALAEEPPSQYPPYPANGPQVAAS